VVDSVSAQDANSGDMKRQVRSNERTGSEGSKLPARKAEPFEGSVPDSFEVKKPK
jgi:hypothetical protein